MLWPLFLHFSSRTSFACTNFNFVNLFCFIRRNCRAENPFGLSPFFVPRHANRTKARIIDGIFHKLLHYSIIVVVWRVCVIHTVNFRERIRRMINRVLIAFVFVSGRSSSSERRFRRKKRHLIEVQSEIAADERMNERKAKTLNAITFLFLVSCMFLVCRHWHQQ